MSASNAGSPAEDVGDRRQVATWVAVALIGLLLVAEFGACLTMDLSGDDFELFSLARIGGLSPRALFVPHRGVFLKPIMNLVWALVTPAAGARAGIWYALCLGTHLLNAGLLGLLATSLARRFSGLGRGVRNPSSRVPIGVHSSFETVKTQSADTPTLFVRFLRFPSDVLFGLTAALIWAVHDRLAEPLFSISSLNHSLTFCLYLLALHVWLRALDVREGREGGPALRRRGLLAALALLLPLFTYEVGVSVIPAAALLLWLVHAPRTAAASTRFSAAPGEDRSALPGAEISPLQTEVSRSSAHSTANASPRRHLGVILAAVVLLYGLAQVCVRASAGSGGYYRFSPILALANVGESALAFLHVAASAVPHGVLAGLGLAALLALAGAALLARDRVIRFGAGWSLVAVLPIALIPELSDRYHYIVFAGVSLVVARVLSQLWRPAGYGLARRGRRGGDDAVGPPSRGGPAAVRSSHRSLSGAALRPAGAAAAIALGAHLVISFAGSMEQARYYRFKAALPGSLLRGAGAMIDASLPGGAGAGRLIVVVWPDEPDFTARRIAAYDANRRWRWIGETSHPIYVRPAAILGAVYPADLIDTAGASHGLFVREASPAAAARAIRENRVIVMPFVPGPIPAGAPANPASWVADELRLSLGTARLPTTVHPPALSPLRLAYLETTDRKDAFEAEYRASSD